jgi:hypothetical protein
MSVLKAHEDQKKSNLNKNELNTTFFCSTTPLKGSKSLKIFKINLTFRFDKLSHLSKSVHIEVFSYLVAETKDLSQYKNVLSVSNFSKTP